MAGQQRVYRQRIRSTQSLKKIFRAMELIAASRIGKARAHVAAAAPYSRALTRAISAVATHSSVDHPLTTQRTDTNRVAVLTVAADRGMAGAYTANVLREAERLRERLERDDPRFYRPALELAREAIENAELTLARELAERARELEPRLEEPLLLLGVIAREQEDPRLAAEVLRERLELDDELEIGDRAALELELALALADCFARDGDRRSASAAPPTRRR